MAITINIYYKGKNGNALKFANEMINSGLVNKIRNEKGNLKYEYFIPLNDQETILLIDKWESQETLDIHHKSPMMKEIAILRDKYDLKMEVEKFTEIDLFTKEDLKYIKR